jgi:hypothetical protein
MRALHCELIVLWKHDLVSFWKSCIQVRQLQSLSLPIKREILAEVETATKFYRRGLILCDYS